MLYVGCSACPAARFANHRSIRTWAQDVVNIRIVWFETREEALAFERSEIMRLKPKHNSEWQTKKSRPWQANESLIYMQNWRDNHGGSAELLAERLFTTPAHTKKYFERICHPSTRRATQIALATEGYVPRHAFDRCLSVYYPKIPILRFPDEAKAQAEVSEILKYPLPRHLGYWIPPSHLESAA
jgi:hypothetical protein